MTTRALSLGVVGCAVAVAIGVTAGLVSPNKQPSSTVSESDFGGAADLRELVALSSVIVTANFIGEAEEIVDLPSPVDGKVYSQRKDRVMRFAPTETLKSDRAVSEELIVRSAVSLSTWEDDPGKATVQEFGRTELNKEALYALFLTRFSESTGEALGPAGPGGIAEIRSGRLRFIAAEELMRTGEIRTALFTSEPTMEEVRTAVALAEPLTPLPTVDPNSPAVVYGERMTRFADGLQRAVSRAEVDALLYESRFQRGQIEDRTVCMKVEAALETEGWRPTSRAGDGFRAAAGLASVPV